MDHFLPVNYLMSTTRHLTGVMSWLAQDHSVQEGSPHNIHVQDLQPFGFKDPTLNQLTINQFIQTREAQKTVHFQTSLVPIHIQVPAHPTCPAPQELKLWRRHHSPLVTPILHHMNPPAIIRLQHNGTDYDLVMAGGVPPLQNSCAHPWQVMTDGSVME